MSMMEPFTPHEKDAGEVEVPAADPGTGAPPTAPGTGPQGEEQGSNVSPERSAEDGPLPD
ncbi:MULTISPECIES: hypothetical protein [Kineococcus]|uniref:hypothetical protein n=1 Tax=unclassified Kineococcus TaxID=2621656 RepID=UPI001F5A576F|nr:hypothetical protein [Kineococcus sp. TRM81007]MCI2239510.1 hypothetical protein [Kineococcus sp. TRM81007]